MTKVKGTIGILTGGGDVPGLNPAIRAATIRANRNGYKMVGLRNGWEGIMNIDRSKALEDQTVLPGSGRRECAENSSDRGYVSAYFTHQTQ
ncbi:MAG: hypothetical protein Ct9H300mP28_14920 [Pseudomonadota bacterium]|nr:MAG: hypothetical protein Ct9H300mP28_14920 [Pseudomonadota bacterium]